MIMEANVDDLDPRLWPGVLSSLLDAGAADAWLIPILMKKGRPAYTLSVLVRPDQAAEVRELIMERTSTLGVRTTAAAKWALPRGYLDVPVTGGSVTIKIAHRDGVIVRATPEFADVARVATARGIAEQRVLVEATAPPRPPAWCPARRSRTASPRSADCPCRQAGRRYSRRQEICRQPTANRLVTRAINGGTAWPIAPLTPAPRGRLSAIRSAMKRTSPDRARNAPR